MVGSRVAVACGVCVAACGVGEALPQAVIKNVSNIHKNKYFFMLNFLSPNLIIFVTQTALTIQYVGQKIKQVQEVWFTGC